MATTKISAVLQKTTAAIYNPALIQDAISDTLLGINGGIDYDVLDPNNPVIWSLEGSAILAQTSIESHTKTLRRRNAIMAVDMEDLYGHMSDEDWIDPFAQPSRAGFQLILGKLEIIEKAYPKNSNETRKLVIPADTEFLVGGLTYTTQYPIELLVLPNGGLQIVYDATATSPIRSLTSRSLNWSITTIPYNGIAVEMVVIEIPAQQYQITTHNDNITSGISWKNSYSISSSYFYARVWRRVSGSWTEIPTSHSLEVLDLTTPTAQLRVLESELEVYIPDVYVREGLISGDIRVDVYSTEGDITVNLQNYDVSEFSVKFRDIGGTISSSYTSPLKTFKHFSLFSGDIATGGRDALTFEEIRTRVIDNSFGGRVLPVSEKQLVNTVGDLGFDVTKSIDYVTERIYLATADMPDPTAVDNLTTPVGTVNGIFETSADELTATSGVNDNGNRITILPNTIYRYDNGLVELNDIGLDEYRRMDPNTLVSLVNEEVLLYTPFHYVLDFNDSIVEERAYYLDEPKITNKRFVSTNNTLQLEVSTSVQSIEATDTGYRLLLKTVGDDTYRSLQNEQKHAQISFTPRGYTDEYAYLDGELIGFDDNDDAIFEFIIETSIDIDRFHDMIVNSFILVGDAPTPIAMMLECLMNVIYSVTSYEPDGYRTSTVDQMLISDDSTTKAVTYEVLTLNLGSHLPSLWTNARTIVGSVNYKRHTEDVYVTYSKNVLAKNPTTNTPAITFVDDGNGGQKASFTVEHAAGDFVLDKFGEKQLLKSVGDPVIGSDGLPEIQSPRSIRRRLELFLMDAKFLISDDEQTVAYMEEVKTTLLQYINTDLPSVDTNLLEKTELYFYPRSSLGLIGVLLGDGSTTTINPEIEFMVYYYLTTAARQNGDFLDTLAETTRSAILAHLSGSTVSSSAITSEIRSRMGSEIIDVELGGMGNDGNQRVFTLLDDSSKPTLGKKLKVNPDRTISIKDSISISYNSHEVSE